MLTKQKTKPSHCRICGEPALYRYFGIISCHACKIFFKRNAQMGLKSFHCLSNKNCEIDRTNRHICTWCRLNKCFQSGMQIELIRCSRIPKSNWSILTNHQIKSLLDNQTILTLIQNQINLPVKLRLKTSSIDPLFTMIIEHLNLFFEMNSDFFHLSFHDRQILFQSIMTNTAHILLNLFFNEIPLAIENLFFKSNNHELIFLKLVIINLMFRKNFNRQLFDNNQQIFQLENFYIDLIWKYLHKKYNLIQIINCFIEYFQVILFLIKTLDQMTYHQNLVEKLLNKIKY